MVLIPTHFAGYVEYDGDPGFGAPRAPLPARQPASPLRSFGFEVRYPDMAGLDKPEMWQDKRRYSLRDTPWLDVAVKSGESYPGDGFMDRLAYGMTEAQHGGAPVYNLEKLPEEQFGLDVYAAPGTDPESGLPYRQHKYAYGIYVKRDSAGHAQTYIKCTNRNAQTGGGMCLHTFNLGGNTHAEVNVQYRRGLLPEWRNIQGAVARLLFSFEARPLAPEPVVLVGSYVPEAA